MARWTPRRVLGKPAKPAKPTKPSTKGPNASAAPEDELTRATAGSDRPLTTERRYNRPWSGTTLEPPAPAGRDEPIELVGTHLRLTGIRVARAGSTG